VELRPRLLRIITMLLTSLLLSACGGEANSTTAPSQASRVAGTPSLLTMRPTMTITTTLPSPTATLVLLGRKVDSGQGSYTEISAAKLQAMMQRKDFFLVDVHVPHQGRLPNLDARIPFDKIAANPGQLPADKNTRIVLTWRSGRMSTIASRTLVGLGYTNVFNLTGGFEAWQAAGYSFLPEP